MAYLQKTDEAEADRALEKLVYDFAQPLVRDIITFKLRVNSGGQKLCDEAADLAGDVTTKLVKRPNQLKARQEAKA